MRTAAVFTMLLVITSTALFAQAGTIPTGGKNRDYIVYTPTGLSDNAPLILALHALGQTNTAFRSSSGWDKIADREKFVVAYPVGITTVNMQGMNLIGWDITGESDVNFLTALIDTMATRYKINRKRVYSTGFSMGGMMSYVLACRQSDKIAAIGPDAGYPVGQNASTCKPSVPVPVCHVHGADDDFVKVSELPPWIKRFAEVDKCQSTPVTTSGAKYKKEDYTPCDNGNDVILYTITGMAHAYATSSANSFSATDTFWTFFSKHPGTTGMMETVTGTSKVKILPVEYHTGTISLPEAEDAKSVSLFDLTGRMVTRWNAPETHSLKTGSLPNGIYMLSIVGRAGGSSVQRLSIQ